MVHICKSTVRFTAPKFSFS